MFFSSTKHLPRELTSYDLLKSLAVILMIVDHIGFYFYRDDLWWRAVASSGPLWFFFVGYAKGRNLTPPIWIGASLLLVASFVFGSAVFPLNILFAIILVRLVLDPVMNFCLRSRDNLVLLFFLAFVLSIPSWVFWEYGIVGLLVAMTAWLLRHKEERPELRKITFIFCVFSIVSFIVLHAVAFGFEEGQLIVFTASTIGTFMLAYCFKSKTYPVLTEKTPKLAVAALQIMGRYSLYLYVGHVLLFMLIAAKVNPEYFGFFEWSWFW